MTILTPSSPALLPRSNKGAKHEKKNHHEGMKIVYLEPHPPNPFSVYREGELIQFYDGYFQRREPTQIQEFDLVFGVKEF